MSTWSFLPSLYFFNQIVISDTEDLDPLEKNNQVTTPYRLVKDDTAPYPQYFHFFLFGHLGPNNEWLNGTCFNVEMIIFQQQIL